MSRRGRLGNPLAEDCQLLSLEYEGEQRNVPLDSATRYGYGSHVVHVTRIPTARVPLKTSKAAMTERIVFTILKRRVTLRVFNQTDL